MKALFIIEPVLNISIFSSNCSYKENKILLYHSQMLFSNINDFHLTAH